MSAASEQPPRQVHASVVGSQLLIDQVLPGFDLSVVHSEVLRAPAAECFAAARELDLFQAPLVRILLGVRALPQRAASAIRGRRMTTAPEASRRTFRLKDMVGLGWILLGETPDVEMVLGQVSRPWKSVAAAADAPTTPVQFTKFDEPGFAKIATSVRIDPYGDDSSILTLETRVAITDDESRRRFSRYWVLVGPFSSLIRLMALRLLAKQLRRPVPGRPTDGKSDRVL